MKEPLPTQQERQIPRKLQDITCSLDALTDDIKNLEECLRPVLQSTDEAGNISPQTQEENLTPLASELTYFHHRILSTSTTIRDIIRRCEL
jgi:hypothetical protein